MNDANLTNSIVSQGAGHAVGSVEARRVRDDWRVDDHDGRRHDDTLKTEARLVRDSGTTAVAIEKIGAAGILESAKNAFSLALQGAVIDLHRDVNQGFALGRTDAIQFANQARTDAFANTAALNLAIEKTAAAGVLLATQNQAATLAALAACCCEMKLQFAAQENRELAREVAEAQSGSQTSLLQQILGAVITGK